MVKIDSYLRDKVKFYVNTFISKSKNLCSTKMNRALHKTLNTLSKDDTVKVVKFDKGNGCVILDSSDYFKKLDTIVNDKGKFVEIDAPNDKNHPVISKENSVLYYIRHYIKPHDDKAFKNLPSGTQPGKLYGTCKVHKNGNPLRPVVSMIGTPEYDLAKYLDSFIKPNIPDKFMLNSTFSFIDKIKSFEFRPGDKLVSFDVESLFTNVPLEETIGIAADYVYSENSKNTPKFEKSIFIKLLRIATGGIFEYNGKLYKQVDGVTMGSPLGPTLANIFLANIEQEIFATDKNFHPRMYCRYVDDIFTVFSADQNFETMLNVLNTQHPNLKFTYELGNHTLPFLDTNISIKEGDCEIEVYRKKTNTGVMLNFSALVPNMWKAGLVRCMLYRAWIVCSSYELFMKETDKLRCMFSKNGYSSKFFYETLTSFLADRYTPKRQPKDELETNFLLKIPYFGKPSIDFKKKMKDLISKHFNVNIMCVYNSCKVSSYFSLKCRGPRYLTSNVVYRYTCLRDSELFYLGKTKRHLGTRVSEHLNLKCRRGQTEVSKHIINCDECLTAVNEGKVDINHFQIMQKARSDYEVQIREAFLIRKHKPEINKQMYQSGASYFVKIFT